MPIPWRSSSTATVTPDIFRMVYQADWLFTVDGPPLKQGWLRVENGRIAMLGAGETLPSTEPVQRFEGCALLPGLINAHCHLELTDLENKLQRGKSFPDWVKELQGAAADLKPTDYRTAAEDGIRRLLTGGCTTVLDVGNTGEALKALAASPLRAFAYVEGLGLDPAAATARFDNALALAGSDSVTDRFHPGLAPHSAYSCSVDLLRSVMEYQKSHGLPVTIHAAESREEAELFASASGPMQDFCKRIFPAAAEHRKTSPIRWLEAEGLLPDGALIIHGNTLDDADMKILARRKATVVHCPSSHAFFGHPRFPYEKLRTHGIPVCLGTDSLASGDSLSMLEQMRLFSETYPEVPTEVILRMATSVAAQALGLSNVTGKLKVDYQADFIALKMDEEVADLAGNPPTSALIRSTGKVEKIVIGGIRVKDF